MKIVAAIYSHLDFYQPTQHAIRMLSDNFEEVVMVSRNLSKAKFTFNDNVTLINVGKFKDVRASEKLSVISKAYSFFLFCADLFKVIRKTKPGLVIFYDHISLYAFRLIRPLLRKNYIVWYHNHDVAELSAIKKYSVGWWAVKFEANSLVQFVDIFSLPAIERKKFFPMQDFKGSFFFIPNYPSLLLFKKYVENHKLKYLAAEKTVKLLYQGTLSEGHGFEELISILNEKVDEKEIELNLIGYISETYKSQLLDIAEKANVNHRFRIHPPVPYSELADFTLKHHIGIGISKPLNIVYQTGGTASNKIYEYAAFGMPVILYDNDHYREHLAKFGWAFFTDCSTASLKHNLKAIIDSYTDVSKKAQQDFINELNFELNFQKAINYVLQLTGAGSKIKMN